MIGYLLGGNNADGIAGKSLGETVDERVMAVYNTAVGYMKWWR